MTFWLDAQLSPELCSWLGSTFKIIVKTLAEIDLRDATDDELFAAAARFNEIVIITKDVDVAELVTRFGPPPQIVWLRFPNMRLAKMRSLLSMTFATVMRHLESGAMIVEVRQSGECKITPKP